MLGAVVLFGAVGTIAGTVTGGAKGETFVYVTDVVAPAAPGTIRELWLRDKQYATRVNVVVVGTTVRWVNDDPIYHNVFSVTPREPFDLGSFKSGFEPSRAFDAPGPISLYCNLHAAENGHLLVAPSTLFAKVGTDGTFTIAGVPAGPHVIRTFAPSRKATELSVDVADGATSTVTVEIPRHYGSRWRLGDFPHAPRKGPWPPFPERPAIP